MRYALIALAAFLYAAGWLAGKIWWALTWGAAAVRVGWADAGRRNPASTAAAGEPERASAVTDVPPYPVPTVRAEAA